MEEVRVIDRIKQELTQYDQTEGGERVFDLPPSSLKVDNNQEQIELSTLLRRPDFNESDEVARGENGQLKRLSPDMLASIRETGKFTIPSVRFPGQTHEWDLNNFLQKGKHATRETFRDGVCFTAECFVIHIPDFLWRSDGFSFVEGVKSLASILKVFGHIIGWSERITTSKHRHKYSLQLTTLLSILLSEEDNTEDFKNQLKDGTVTSFITVDGVKIYITNFRDIKAKLKEPFSQFSSEWLANKALRRKTLSDFLLQDYPDPMLRAQEVVNIEAKQEQEAIFSMIYDTLSEEEAQRICSMISAMIIIREKLESYRKTRNNALTVYSKELREKHIILSRSHKWLSRKTSLYMKQWSKDHPIEEWISQISTLLTPSTQEKYLFDKNLEIASEVSQELKALTSVPAHVFNWNFRIWRPKNWKVTRSEYKSGDNTHYEYTVDKYTHYETTTYYPGWRISKMFISIAQYFNNGLFGLVANTVYGPYGLRSLFGLDDFQPDKTIDSKTGELKSCGSKYTTWFGRIRKLWRHIIQSRHEFESAKDEKMFGKSLVRPFNCFWNYVIKGAFGTVLAFLYHPIVTIANVLISGALTLTSPVWSVLSSIFVYIWNLFIYDGTTGSFFPIPKTILYDFLIKGVGRMLLAPVVTLGTAALAALAYAWNLLRYGCRSLWDGLVFYTFIRPFARIPNRDGFSARRVRGPGLGMTYYQEISPELGLISIRYQLETEQMTIYRVNQHQCIEEPLNNLNNYLSQFRQVGLVPDYEFRLYQRLKANQDNAKKALNKAIDDHNKSLIVKGFSQNSSIRFTRESLKYVLDAGEVVCRDFCKQSFFDRNPYYWSSKNIIEGDYRELAVYYLKQSFRSCIVEPIEDAAEGFRTKVDHPSFKEYLKVFSKGDFRSDLDRVVNNESFVAEMTYPSPNISVITPDNLDVSEEVSSYVTIHF